MLTLFFQQSLVACSSSSRDGTMGKFLPSTSYAHWYCHCFSLVYTIILGETFTANFIVFQLLQSSGLSSVILPFLKSSIDVGAVIEMLPLGLCFPWSINLCMVSTCGFLWLSPFAELETSLIKPTSLTRPSLNYKSIQRCSNFFLVRTRLSLTLLFPHTSLHLSPFLYEKLTPRLAPRNEWELFELLVKIVLQWLPEGRLVTFCC